MSPRFWAELSNNYEKLFETEIGYDVIIYAGDESNVKEIHAHSNILSVRSQYFHTAFSNEWAEKRDGKFIFRKSNISPQLFKIILRFIYCGSIELKYLQGPEVFKLLIAVDELNIQELISHVQEFLIDNQAEFLRQNPTGLLETVYEHETFTDLWKFCLEEICEQPRILFDSDGFIDLKPPLLEILLRDDLDMNEIEIWENLLKWCLAQQKVTSDPVKWSKEDITKVENSLHRFIPLVPFYDIDPTDFFYKVYCYKDVLPQDLIYDLLEFHIVPGIKPKTSIASKGKKNLNSKLDSALISSDHIPPFASWIDREDYLHYNKKNIPYEFKLLYRSSKDEFNARSFHRKCDNKGATIWVAKLQDSTQLIGGYNPLDWSGKDWKITADSFLFNFTDGQNILTAKLGYVNNPNYAIYCDKNYGPHMGNLKCHLNDWEYVYDELFISDNVYPNIDIPAKLSIDVYEVFQIIKKVNI